MGGQGDKYPAPQITRPPGRRIRLRSLGGRSTALGPERSLEPRLGQGWRVWWRRTAPGFQGAAGHRAALGVGTALQLMREGTPGQCTEGRPGLPCPLQRRVEALVSTQPYTDPHPPASVCPCMERAASHPLIRLPSEFLEGVARTLGHSQGRSSANVC